MTNLVVISKPVVTATNAAGVVVHTQSMVVLGPTWMIAGVLLLLIIGAFFAFARR